MCFHPINNVFITIFDYSQNQARLRVSLENLQVKTKQRVETVTISDFLAFCGGILGLFMGFSALSVIEIIYYPLLRLYWMYQRLKTEKEEKKPDESANTAKEKPSEINNGGKSVSNIKHQEEICSKVINDICE